MADEEQISTAEDTQQTTDSTEQPDKTQWGEDISPDKDEKLFKKIITEGSGDARPKTGDKVFVHYTGRLLDGTVFDSSVSRNELFSFELGQNKVIKGWDVGVATMRKGEKCLLTCAPDFAYGEQGAGENIPPNSTLQFEVELFRWQGEDVTNDGGVIKNIIKEGEGYQKPSEGSAVTVSLHGSVGETVFDDRKDVEFCLGEGSEAGIVEGIEKALEKMKKGEEVELIIQPNYAFGPDGSTEKNVPPNTEVTYIVTLTNFVKVKSSYEYDNADERITDATATKEKGSEYFKAGKYSLALKVYRRGLKIVDKDSVYKDEEKEATRSVRVLLRLNIAACLLKLNEGSDALHECESLLEEDPTSVKGHFRKGQALQIIRDYELAMQCFQKVIEIDAGNRAARQQILACKNKIKEQRDKDKKMYTDIFQKMSKMSKKEQEELKKKNASAAAKDKENNDDNNTTAAEKDAITEAMEVQDEKKEEPPAPSTQEGTVNA